METATMAITGLPSTPIADHETPLPRPQDITMLTTLLLLADALGLTRPALLDTGTGEGDDSMLRYADEITVTIPLAESDPRDERTLALLLVRLIDGRLALFERRLDEVEARLRERCDAGGPSVADSLARIADALDPPPPDVVGSPYVAGRLGCTTVWVAEMARSGAIPASCVVPGTGNGKPWKFHRERIDRWLAAR
jgi:hypothetical protein